MFIIALIFAFSGAASVETVKYHVCLKHEFKSDLCGFEKKLEKLKSQK